MTVYAYTHGYASTEQDAVSALNDFLVNTIGWTLVETVSDTAADRDYAWSSAGTSAWQSAGGDPIYIRVRANANTWQCHGYRTYTDSSTNTFEVYHNNGTHLYFNTPPMYFWFYGDENFVCCLFVETVTLLPVSCYLGLITSYYSIEEDDYPMLIKGSPSYTSSWNSVESCYMHNCTTSGVQSHTNMDWVTFLQYDRGNRDGNSVTMLPIVTCNTNASNNEMRGEPVGVYQVNGFRLPTYGAITTASGTYITLKGNNADGQCNAFGPVHSSDCSTFDMWGGTRWDNGSEL